MAVAVQRARLAARAAAIFQLSDAPKAVSGTSLKATNVPATVAKAPRTNAARSLPVSLKTRLQGARRAAGKPEALAVATWHARQCRESVTEEALVAISMWRSAHAARGAHPPQIGGEEQEGDGQGKQVAVDGVVHAHSIAPADEAQVGEQQAHQRRHQRATELLADSVYQHRSPFRAHCTQHRSIETHAQDGGSPPGSLRPEPHSCGEVQRRPDTDRAGGGAELWERQATGGSCVPPVPPARKPLPPSQEGCTAVGMRPRCWWGQN